MMINVKTIILIISVLGNALSIALVVSAVTSPRAAFISFSTPAQMSVTAAMVVSVPFDAGYVNFNPVEMTLRVGQSASLQISSVIAGQQANWIIQALYDRSILSISPNPQGITITAIAPGECVIQTLAGDGITDVAFIQVIP